jgi:hypothetical protein
MVEPRDSSAGMASRPLIDLAAIEVAVLRDADESG